MISLTLAANFSASSPSSQSARLASRFGFRVSEIHRDSISTDAKRGLSFRDEMEEICGSVIVRNGEVNYALREAML
jgi:hypothetical protein